MIITINLMNQWISGIFFLYSGITAITFVFVYIFVPETKGKSIEEIELLFISKNERVKRRKKNLINAFHLVKFRYENEIWELISQYRWPYNSFSFLIHKMLWKHRNEKRKEIIPFFPKNSLINKGIVFISKERKWAMLISSPATAKRAFGPWIKAYRD